MHLGQGPGVVDKALLYEFTQAITHSSACLRPVTRIDRIVEIDSVRKILRVMSDLDKVYKARNIPYF